MERGDLACRDDEGSRLTVNDDLPSRALDTICGQSHSLQTRFLQPPVMPAKRIAHPESYSLVCGEKLPLMDRHTLPRIAVSFAALSLAFSAYAEIPKPDDAPPPRSPEESAKCFRVPEGFRVELIASEPLIHEASGVCWDERGRMFVCELHGYNLEGQFDIEELNKTGVLDTVVRRIGASEVAKERAKVGTFGTVKMLRDTDGDGRMNVAEVWAENLPPCYGIVAARGGVIVACAPDIVWLAEGGRRETLFTGFGTGALERGVNAPQWGGDGWIYFGRGHGGGRITGPHLAAPVPLGNTDFRIRADGTAIEPVTGGANTIGFAFTESGEKFVTNTTKPGIQVAPLAWRYLVRNPDAATPSLDADATRDGHCFPVAPPHPWRTKRANDPGFFKYYRDRYGAAESEAEGWFTSACSPLIYKDAALPGLRGQYFVCEPAGGLVHRALLSRERDGAVKLTRAAGEERSEFLASSDPWFHPMNLAHAPDGSLVVVDFYREIIEDYSAVPRFLQQQYGVINGHDRGRIWRLTHRDAPPAEPANMSLLGASALAHEVAGERQWRRETAQRLLIERGEKDAVPALRALLAEAREPAALLHTLDVLGALTPDDVRPFLAHADAGVRAQSLALADRWFAKPEGAALLDGALDRAHREDDPRVLLQLAMSLGEASDPRAFAALARLAREHGDVRWMPPALLSSLHGRGAEMLAELERVPGNSAPLLAPLKASIAAHDKKPVAPVSKTPAPPAPPLPPRASDETIARFIAALAGPRDAEHGHQVFLQQCALCHRIGAEGNVVGPDLAGEFQRADETIVHDVLMPGEYIRPGYETTFVELRDGTSVAGILKNDAATSLTLLLAGGAEYPVLHKDIARVTKTADSLMTTGFAEALQPRDLADIIGWLRATLHAPDPGRVILFDEEPNFPARLNEGDGTATLAMTGAFAGKACLAITPPQRFSARLPGWAYRIVETPGAPGEYRWLRLAWRTPNGDGVMLELARAGQWPQPADPHGRYFAGRNTSKWSATQTSANAPAEWTVVTLDLWKDMGAFTLTGLAPTAMGGTAFFDRLELLRTAP